MKKLNSIGRLTSIVLMLSALSCYDKKTEITDPGSCQPPIQQGNNGNNKYIDFCGDLHFSVGYKQGSINGIDSIQFKEITVDDCGYVGTSNGGIIGEQRQWEVANIKGTPSAVSTLNGQIGDAKILCQAWPLFNGQPGSMMYGNPNTANQVHVIMDVTGTGRGSLDSLVTNGMASVNLHAYGGDYSTGQSRDFVIPIR